VYFNEWRRQNRFELLDQGTSPVRAVEGDQEWKLWISDVTGRFAGLHPEQREALMLVCANGYSYDHAAEIAGCPPGTMKSRVFRARSELRTMLSCDDRNGTTDHLHACITAVSAAA
jgi:RNA polymerase sigma-70 factor (ECF subfamily)